MRTMTTLAVRLVTRVTRFDSPKTLLETFELLILEFLGETRIIKIITIIIIIRAGTSLASSWFSFS